jgi:alpha-tubulin suppressor-like RCC1 family protein
MGIAKNLKNYLFLYGYYTERIFFEASTLIFSNFYNKSQNYIITKNENLDIPYPLDLNFFIGKNIEILKASPSYYHCLILTTDKIYAWGYQFANGLDKYTKDPVEITIKNNITLLNEEIIDISAGDRFSIALSKNGKVFAWGYNYYGFF